MKRATKLAVTALSAIGLLAAPACEKSNPAKDTRAALAPSVSATASATVAPSASPEPLAADLERAAALFVGATSIEDAGGPSCSAIAARLSAEGSAARAALLRTSTRDAARAVEGAPPQRARVHRALEVIASATMRCANDEAFARALAAAP